MILINEWLPNPVGNDASGEFVELFNSGSAPVNVGGWTLEASAKKPKKISGAIPANGYLVFYRKQTKLVLKNSDEAIALYDAAGRLVDQSSFAGSAPEGKSFSRIAVLITPSSAGGGSASGGSSTSERGRSLIQNFAWGDPTPGVANRVTANTEVTTMNYAFNTPVNHVALGIPAVVAMLLTVAVCVTALVVYSIKTNAELSQLFFE